MIFIKNGKPEESLMKTSNKVLLIIIIGFFTCIFFAAMISRTIVRYEHFSNLPGYVSSSGKATTTKNFAINNFSELEIDGAATIAIKIGEKPEMKITTSGGGLDNIAVNLSGKKLHINVRRGVGKNFNKEIFIDIITSYPLEKITLSGAGDLSYTDIIGDNLTIVISGAVDARLSGKIENFQIDASGASDIDAKNLIANNVVINAFGASDIIVYAKKYLKVNLFGAADVHCYGQPKKIERNIAGAGSVRLSQE